MIEPEDAIGENLVETAPEDWAKLCLYVRASDDSFRMQAQLFRLDGSNYSYHPDSINKIYKGYWALRKQFETAGQPLFTWFVFTVNKDRTFEIEYGYNPIKDLDEILPAGVF